MKFQQDFVGSKAEFADFIKKIIPDLFAGKLSVEGRNVVLPGDRELDYKIKFTEEEDGGAFNLKVSWENTVEEEEDDELQLEVD
ncbi:MAG TPA: amphi-Trp domain-containing protein [Ruminiclostridium sp.]|jgi:amphi-Trp domain-containing protein|uniref:Transcription initiation factor IIE n=1 Tax=Acetivibrio saccincola TaxID=1677857 RepID=A0A2K9E1Z8_9FIRM|nr:amphi-Trp domain-containing protein [Acetivibrio saccincola]HAA42765.1 amphi-Trp domain-containing protein [Ruminiclostridium sp.]AUG57409.1 hypothetical protein HVS_07470 [Acetivibrio saccincola]NLW26559.1 amphi-Trp domain-containing protein [Acetivibrio saccincola]PQQ67336.1 transcription initiation factor IIE [Acetivibrio saccincola]HOA96190.1 amphi-Trp domain-containing protein [Acetivibrio saccincola]